MVPRRAVFLFLVCTLFPFLAPAPVARSQARADVRIMTDVELVQIPVIVFDEKGAVAAHLSKNDFRILEDGVEQRILYCERERESVSFVILADVSGSMKNKLPFVQEAVLSILDPVNPLAQYRDEFSVFGIETRVKRLVPFTSDQQDLQRRLPGLLTPTDGSTALFDGVYRGIAAARDEAENKRRAMIIISDGGDNHSRYKLRDTKKLLEEADVPVFAVMAGPFFQLSDLFPFPAPQKKRQSGPQFQNFPRLSPQQGYIGPAERRGPHNLKTLTEATGGGVFTARHLEDLPRIVQTISNAVRYRYLLTYRPSHAAKPEDASNWHKLRVELYPKERFASYSMPYYKTGYHRIH